MKKIKKERNENINKETENENNKKERNENINKETENKNKNKKKK